MPKHDNAWREHVRNAGRVMSAVLAEMENAVQRAIQSGAIPPLEYKGAGSYGIVLCDESLSFKVFRHWPAPVIVESLIDEYEWFDTARRVPEISEYVPQTVEINRDAGVLIRECVNGHPGTWGDESWLHDIHRTIDKAMLPHGWTSPEFKGDSYIVTDAERRKAVIVDGSLAQRVGETLFRYVREVNEGIRTRPGWLRPGDENFFLCREVREGELDAGEVDEYLANLGQKPCWRPT